MKNVKYHVCQEWDGEDLRPLADRIGESAAIDLFCKRWPEMGFEVALYYVHYIFFYNTLEEAKNHQDEFGGDLLEIDMEYVELNEDWIQGYKYTTFDVSKDFIRKMK